MKTTKEIAAEAGVSVTTVSLVMNNKPGVGHATRKRVLEIASSYNYKHRFRKGDTLRSGTLQFLRITKHGHIVNESHKVSISDYVDGMTARANDLKFDLQVYAFSSMNLQEIVASIDKSLIKGLIVLGTELDAADISRFTRLGLSTVFLDCFHDTRDFDFVCANSIDSAALVVAHFAATGHRRVGFVGSRVESNDGELLEEGFYRGLSHHGFSSDPRLRYTVDPGFDGSYRDMLKILKSDAEMPTALFVVDDVIAAGCIKAMTETGIRIPNDVSVIGFGNLAVSAMIHPPLTTVRVNNRQIGRIAVDLLAARIADPTLSTMKLQVTPELVLRESVTDRLGETAMAE